MKQVRAKFLVHQVTEHMGGNATVVLNAVGDNNKENQAFWKYTPSGKLEMCISPEAGGGIFKPGDEFYLDFTKVEKPQPEPQLNGVCAAPVEHIA